MKKYFLILFALVFILQFDVTAAKKEKSSLVGLWQSRTENKNPKTPADTLLYLPFLKEISPDYTFKNFVMRAGSEPTVITVRGSYEIKGDHYVEKLNTHYLDPKLNGSETDIKYWFLDENTVVFQFLAPGQNWRIEETWVRINNLKR